MGLGKLIKKVGGGLTKVAMKATPAGQAITIASLARKAVSGAKRVVKAGVSSSPSLMSAVQRAMGVVKKRKKKSFGISDKEAIELMKLKMFVSPRSIPYQMAVMKCMNRRVK